MNLIKFYTGLCLVLSFSGTLYWMTHSSQHEQSLKPRRPASINPSDITQELLKFKSEFESSSFNLRSCENILSRHFAYLSNFRFHEFNTELIQPQASSLMHQVFHTRTDLRKKMKTLFLPLLNNAPHENSQISRCAWAFRRAFRGMRVLEDYLGEASVGFPFDRERGAGGRSSDHKMNIMPAFQGGHNFLMWNREFNPPGYDYQPRSGDVILSRGTASTSAAIARISDEDTNFSHLSIVWVDPNDPNNRETIEAHIEIGTDVFNWRDYVSDQKVRAVVFRYKNPDQEDEKNAEIAHQAADKIRRMALEYKRQHGKRICYDFSMNMNDRGCIFCSEIIRVAFEEAGISGIPFFPSPIQPKNRKFIESIGVTEQVTFAPADIELDPRFDLVAEWRDHNRIHRTHFMDAVLTSMYDWMDSKDYEFYPSAEQKFKSTLGFTLRRIPLLDLTVKNQFPLNMKKEAIETVQVLNTVVNRLSDYIDLREQQIPHQGPKRLSPKEMTEILQAYRSDDSLYYDENLKGLLDQLPLPKNIPQHHFHSFFRARGQ